MYQRKHCKPSSGKSGKSIALLVSLLLIVGMTVGGTFAFLIDVDDRIDNVFTPSKVTTSVEETLKDGTKTNVSIKNTGDTEAYIRAAVVITWQDKDGNVYGKAPVLNTDYEIDWGNGWLTGADGFYYWTSPVAANGGMTGDLIESCSSKGTAPEGYYLNVEIIGSGIQSVPTSVVTTEWNSGVSSVSNDGTLTIK